MIVGGTTGIAVYRGNEVFCRIPICIGSKAHFTLMKEDYITLKFSADELIEFTFGDYVDLNPADYDTLPADSKVDTSLAEHLHRYYEITAPYTPNYNASTGGYDYELRFDAYYWKWQNKLNMLTTRAKDGTLVRKETSWAVTDTPDRHLGVLVNNLRALGYKYRSTGLDKNGKVVVNYTEYEYNIHWDATLKRESKVISYDNISILDSLWEIAKTWECDCWVVGNVIHLGRAEGGRSLATIRNGMEATRITASKSQKEFATRLYAFGSTKNIISTYRKNLIFDIGVSPEAIDANEKDDFLKDYWEVTDAAREVLPAYFHAPYKTYRTENRTINHQYEYFKNSSTYVSPVLAEKVSANTSSAGRFYATLVSFSILVNGKETDIKKVTVAPSYRITTGDTIKDMALKSEEVKVKKSDRKLLDYEIYEGSVRILSEAINEACDTLQVCVAVTASYGSVLSVTSVSTNTWLATGAAGGGTTIFNESYSESFQNPISRDKFLLFDGFTAKQSINLNSTYLDLYAYDQAHIEDTDTVTFTLYVCTEDEEDRKVYAESIPYDKFSGSGQGLSYRFEKAIVPNVKLPETPCWFKVGITSTKDIIPQSFNGEVIFTDTFPMIQSKLVIASGDRAGEELDVYMNFWHKEKDNRLFISKKDADGIVNGVQYTLKNLIVSKVPSSLYTDEDTKDVKGSSERRLRLPLGVISNIGYPIYRGLGYVDAYANMPDSDVVEKTVIFEDIYPRVKTQIVRLDAHVADKGVEHTDDVTGATYYEKWTYYRFMMGKEGSLQGLAFSEDYLLYGQDLSITFQSGSLSGMTFKVKFKPDPDDPVADYLFEIEANEDYGRLLPDTTLHPSNGDEFVMFGCDTSFITENGVIDAEKELLAEAQSYLKKLTRCDTTYEMVLNPFWANGRYEYTTDGKEVASSGQGRYFDLGDLVTIQNNTMVASDDPMRTVRIIGYEFNLDIPYDSPVYKMGETIEYSRSAALLDKLEGMTVSGNSVGGGSGTGGGAGVSIIKEYDSTHAKDTNVYSAKRSDKNYLSKTQDDSTTHTLSVGGINVNGNASIKGSANIQNELNVAGNANLNSVNLGKTEFIQGLQGGRIYEDENGIHAEFDYINVHKKAIFNEIEVDKLTYVAGTQVITPASGFVVSGIAELKEDNRVFAYRLYWPANVSSVGEDVITAEQTSTDVTVNNTWEVGDQARVQTYNNSGIRYWWRVVIGVGEYENEETEKSYNYIDVANGDYIPESYKTDDKIRESEHLCELDSDKPMMGDEVAMLGNRIDKNRQNAIIISAVLNDPPSFATYTGINTFSIPTPITKISPKDTRISADNVYIGGKTNINQSINQLHDEITDVSKQMDESFQVWYGEDDTDPNALVGTEKGAEITWATLDDKIEHNGDFFITLSGYCYKYTFEYKIDEVEEEEEGTEKGYTILKDGWVIVSDQYLVKFVNQVQKKADVFYSGDEGWTPTSYKKGDVWMNATIGPYKNEILVCKDTNDHFELKDWQAAADYRKDVEKYYNQMLALADKYELQRDKKVSTYFVNTIQDMDNLLNDDNGEPKTNEELEDMLGDVCYVKEEGEVFEFTRERYEEDVTESSGYAWVKIVDEITKAVIKTAKDAIDVADGKRTTFICGAFGEIVKDDYSYGDLWANVNGSYETGEIDEETGTPIRVIYENDLLICIKDKEGSFNINDWVKACNYLTMGEETKEWMLDAGFTKKEGAAEIFADLLLGKEKIKGAKVQALIAYNEATGEYESAVNITATSIRLEGCVTANRGFAIGLDGSVQMNNATISGMLTRGAKYITGDNLADHCSFVDCPYICVDYPKDSGIKTFDVPVSSLGNYTYIYQGGETFDDPKYVNNITGNGFPAGYKEIAEGYDAVADGIEGYLDYAYMGAARLNIVLPGIELGGLNVSNKDAWNEWLAPVFEAYYNYWDGEKPARTQWNTNKPYMQYVNMLKCQRVFEARRWVGTTIDIYLVGSVSVNIVGVYHEEYDDASAYTQPWEYGDNVYQNGVDNKCQKLTLKCYEVEEGTHKGCIRWSLGSQNLGNMLNCMDKYIMGLEDKK